MAQDQRIKPLSVAIVGAAGRMGQELIAAIAQHSCQFELIVAVEHQDLLENLQKSIALQHSGARCTHDLGLYIQDCDVVIDFSSPKICLKNAQIAQKHQKAFVSGTTGLLAKQHQALVDISQSLPVFYASNFSVGVNILAHLTELAAKATGAGFDIEIFESHHRNKVDAPSGTALTLAQSAAAGRDLDLEQAASWTRHGHTGARQSDTIGFQVLRGGDIVGEHTVFLCADGERIELTHRATNRAIFAHGALRAAKWLCGQKVGLYSMKDLLFS